MGTEHFTLPSAPVWNLGSRKLVLSRPYVMGVLNVTPDSFSDGGMHNEMHAAIDFAMGLVEAGADIIDVGGESTRPGCDPVAVEEEMARVLPVVSELARRGVIVSIDTYHPVVAQACLDAGATILNDISGFSDPMMVEVAAGCDAGVITMHMAGKPKDMQADPRYDDAVVEIREYLINSARNLEAHGVAHDRICIDPGPGFGKNNLHNLQLIAGMSSFASAGYPVLAAFSRKGTLGKITGIQVAADRVIPSETAAVLSYCGGASIVRVHDVEQTVQALQVAANASYAAHAAGLGGNLATLLPGKRAIVALGSNMGDPVANLVEATKCLDKIPHTRLIASSSIYQSEPAYYDDQDKFANSVAWVQTELEPNELLDELFKIENEFNRKRVIANGPRTLDLDVLDYEGQVSDDPHLIMPHPRIMERDFTVTPLLELEQVMIESYGRYVSPSIIGELGNNEQGDAAYGGFKLADGRRVVRDQIEYGKIVGKLLDRSKF